MNIYLNTEIDFEHNGIGFLTDIIKATVTDNLNGDYSLYFEYKVNGHLSEYIKNENIIKCKVSDGTKQLFVIKNVSKNFDSIQVSCKHIFYLLLDNFVEDTAPNNLSCQQFIKWILDRTNYTNKFQVFSDISIPKTGRYVRKNPVEIILGSDENSVVNLFGGEIKRDNFNINFNKRIGTDNGVKLIIGKNIIGININIDTNSVHTRIMPQGFDGLLLPEKYVDSPLINIYPTPKIYKMEFSNIKYDEEDENAYHDINDAYRALRNATNELFDNGLDKPIINVKVDWIELSKTNEYKEYSNLEKVILGDTITIDLLGITYKTRVIKTIYNVLTERIETFELGTPIANIGTSTNSILNQVQKINPTSILEQAKKDATNKLINALGGYVYKTREEFFIMDTNNPATATKVWRWNLNGLGYSSNGIDGPYETAITSDGQIVADFITTGVLKTSVIEGYDQLVTTVSNIDKGQDEQDKKIAQIKQSVDTIEQQISGEYGMDREVFGTNQVFIEDALKYYPLEIKIDGYSNTGNLLYPGTFYPGDGAFPLEYKEPNTSTLTICVDSQNRNNPTENLVEYAITLNEPLRSLGSIKDELEISVASGEVSAQITRYLDYNGSNIVKRSTPLIEPIQCPKIELLEHENYVYIKEKPNYKIYVRYLVYSTMNEFYATRVELNSSIKQTKDSINLEVSKKAGKNEIISTINQSAEGIKILANKLGITANDVLDIIAGNEINLKSKNIKIKSDRMMIDNLGVYTLFDANGNKIAELNGSGIDFFKNGNRTIRMGTETIKDNSVGPGGGQNWDAAVTSIQYGESIWWTAQRDSGSQYYDPVMWYTNGSSKALMIRANTIFNNEEVEFKGNIKGSLQFTDLTNAGVITTSKSMNDNLWISRIITDGEGNLKATSWLGTITIAGRLSDERFKKNIKLSKENAIEKIKKIKIYSFDFKNSGSHVNNGLVAQQLENIDSSLIIKNDDGKGIYQINELNVLSLAVKAIQEQQKQIDELKKELIKLKKGCDNNG